jgi:hypothetical protein
VGRVLRGAGMEAGESLGRCRGGIVRFPRILFGGRTAGWHYSERIEWPIALGIWELASFDIGTTSSCEARSPPFHQSPVRGGLRCLREAKQVFSRSPERQTWKKGHEAPGFRRRISPRNTADRFVAHDQHRVPRPGRAVTVLHKTEQQLGAASPSRLR